MSVNGTGRQGRRTVDFSEVRRKVSLLWFMENVVMGVPTPGPGNYRFQVCPKCGESSKQNSNKMVVTGETWKCHACGNKGDVIDAAGFWWDMAPKEAAVQLLGDADPEVLSKYKPPQAKPAVERDDSAVEEVIAKLTAASNGVPEPAINYFLGRGIPPAVVKEAARRGLLVVLPYVADVAKEHLLKVCGKEALVAAGLWSPEKAGPGIMYKPLMFVSHQGKAAEFRGLRLHDSAGPKLLRYGLIRPWIWAAEDQDRIMLTEGALDLMAAVALGTKRSIMGLPGCENWRPDWFAKLSGRDVLTAFDDDAPGREATSNITPELIKAGATPVDSYSLPLGAKDLNEELILRSPHCNLEFFETKESKEPERGALLSLPGCDRWTPFQFGRTSGKHVVIRTSKGKLKPSDETIDRLVKVFRRGEATVTVNPEPGSQH